jgi:hypothetical protein
MSAPSPPPRWTPADDDKLRELAIAGAYPKVIEVLLKRTEDAVRARAAHTAPSADGLK